MEHVVATKHALNESECIQYGFFAKKIFGSATTNAEIVIRQLLFRNLVAYKLNETLINKLANPQLPVVYPLPKAWRNVLRKQGYKVAGLRSALLFNGYVCLRFFYGVLSIMSDLFTALVYSLGIRKEGKRGGYVFFCWLSKKNLPPKGANEKSYDIISWYLQWKGRMENLETVVHTVKNEGDNKVGSVSVLSSSHIIPPIDSLLGLFRYIYWVFTALFLSLIDLVRGKWWHALMLSEANQSAQVRIHRSEDLAKDYLFHTSFWIYRPLWTYDAEKKGSRILFYFYSTNIELFKEEKGYPKPTFGWKTATWPHYLVWDEYQAAYIRKWVDCKPDVSVVGPVWFHSGTVGFPKLPKNAVAVFDIQPMREILYNRLALDFDYYTADTCCAFLEDIHECLNEQNVVLALKRKSELGKKIHVRYRNLLDKLGNQTNFVLVDPDFPPQAVIENCMAVISMPFTSTALIGKELNKPSVFYDPKGLLQKDDLGAHGIQILTGKEELRNWMQNIMKLPEHV